MKIFKRAKQSNKKLKKVWRKPRGLDNKLKKKLKGRGKMPIVGYKKPSSIRGTVGGKKIFRVFNVSDLKKTDKKGILLIASGVGKKKRLEILKNAEKQGLHVKNK
ncbi:MAG: 50S ribosomal protein L32e [Candidatus Aenigmarchaeota archaeon]|nr:50S ribosomal protein L32e [Candidatus Aenigmarchaeota archaeon]